MAHENGSMKYDIDIDLYKAKVKLSDNYFRYDGKKKTPKVKVTDAYGDKIPKKYYRVSYSLGRKKPGTYKVKVKFKGKFKSNKTIVKKFRIAK